MYGARNNFLARLFFERFFLFYFNLKFLKLEKIQYITTHTKLKKCFLLQIS